MIATIIQARMGSTRFPGKSMAKLSGKPILWHVIERVRRAKLSNVTVVATTINPEDNAIVNLCRRERVLCFRGSCDDVLERYYQAAKLYQADIAVRITADCPLIDPHVIDLSIRSFKNCHCDYLGNTGPGAGERTFPHGLEVEVFSFAALDRANSFATNAYDREHVIPYMLENKKNEFVIGPMLKATPEYARSYRLTVDYPEDFALLGRIYQTLYKPGTIIDVRDVISLLDQNPALIELNTG